MAALKAENASITIEASIIMPVIITIILFMISLIKIVYIHDAVQHSINDTALVILQSRSESLFQNNKEEEMLKTLFDNKMVFYGLKKVRGTNYIGDKIQEINLKSSKIDQNDIDIIVHYNIKSVFGFIPNYGITQRCTIISSGLITDNTSEYIWGKDYIERGVEIQNIFGKNVFKTAQGKFFKFDIYTNEAIEMRTLDPTLKSYQKSGAILSTVKEDILKFAKCSDYADVVKDGQTIQYKIESKKFILVIPKNTNNEFVAGELDKLNKIAVENGVEFEVIEFGVKG